MNSISAYKITEYGIVVNGNPSRNWMDMTDQKFVYGCLPMIIANELGWDILCQTSFRALWTGGNLKTSIQIQFKDKNNPYNAQVTSHFGQGVLTFHPGFLFRTNKDHNLYVKGVPNYIKDAIQPLEGVIETDWLPFSFTMNWKFTRANTWIEFMKDEPIARILPYPRNYIESFKTQSMPLEENRVLQENYLLWSNDRQKHNEKLQNNTAPTHMEKHYFKGIKKDFTPIEYHQKKIHLNKFPNG